MLSQRSVMYLIAAAVVLHSQESILSVLSRDTQMSQRK